MLPQVEIGRLRDVSSLGDWELVKDNNHRTVVRAPNPNHDGKPDLYLKRYKLSSLTRRLKHLIRPTHAAKEWEVSRILRERNIPTCRVLAIAERRPGLFHREAFLISREIPHAIPVNDYLENHTWDDCPLEQRLSLIGELADLTANMIQQDVGHDDMHAGNIMIKPEGDPGERLFVLDLHRVRIGTIRRKDVVRMLVFLADSTAQRGVGRYDRLRFLRDVLRKWKGADWLTKRRLQEWNDRVRAAWDKHYRRHKRSRTKRCLKSSSDFTPDISKHFKVHRRRDFPLEQALKITHWHDLAMDGMRSQCSIVKDGPRTAVTCCQDSTGGRVFVKAFRRESIMERMKDLLRFRSRARKAWIAHRAFRVRDVPAAPGLCVLEARNKLSGRPDYLLTRDPGVIADLQALALAQSPEHPRHADLHLTPEERRELGCSVARLFCTMARNQVRHRDMKPSNVLVQEDQEGRFNLWLVDLDRARVEVGWTRDLWVYHLAQCNAGVDEGISLLDRMRCLRRIGEGRWSDAERIQIAREILELSLQRDPMWLREEKQ